MKAFWKLLNKTIFLVVIHILVFLQPSFSEIKDIWKQSKEIKDTQLKENLILNKQKELPLTTIVSDPKAQLETFNINQAKIEKESKEFIFGIYDPSTTGISVNFWSNTDPNLFKDLSKTLIKSDNNFVTNHLIKKIFFSKVKISELNSSSLAYLDFISSFLKIYRDVSLIDSVIDQNNLLLNNEKLLKFLIY